MSDNQQQETESDDFMDDDFVSIADCHKLAAEQFQAAAQQHIKAAEAYESGNLYETHRRGYLAHRHQLLATRYAETAAVEEDLDTDSEDEGAAAD
jgi:hypothetical protein